MKMKKLAFGLAAFALISCAFAANAREQNKPKSKNPEAQNLIDKAWSALDQDMTLKEIDESIKYLKQALELDPNNDEILVELADEYYQRGNQMPRNSDSDYEARNKYFEPGHEAALKALSIKETAGAHFWVAGNLSAMNENSSIIKQASMFPEIIGHVNWIEEHDRDYKYGAAARMGSKIASRVPDILIGMVGYDTEKISTGLDEAIASEPRFIDNYVYKAEFHNRMGKTNEALDMLDQALKMDPEAFPEERAYNRFAQREAKKFWKEWTGKEYPNR